MSRAPWRQPSAARLRRAFSAIHPEASREGQAVRQGESGRATYGPAIAQANPEPMAALLFQPPQCRGCGCGTPCLPFLPLLNHLLNIDLPFEIMLCLFFSKKRQICVCPSHAWPHEVRWLHIPGSGTDPTKDVRPLHPLTSQVLG